MSRNKTDRFYREVWRIRRSGYFCEGAVGDFETVPSPGTHASIKSEPFDSMAAAIIIDRACEAVKADGGAGRR